MKILQRIQISFILTTVLLVTVAIAAGAYNNLVPAQATETGIATVILSAQHMSAEEKAAYDSDSKHGSNVQTVIISAKRLNAQQKQASLQEEMHWQQMLVARNATAPSI